MDKQSQIKEVIKSKEFYKKAWDDLLRLAKKLKFKVKTGENNAILDKIQTYAMTGPDEICIFLTHDPLFDLFILAHELGHVYYGHIRGKSVNMEEDERKANEFAFIALHKFGFSDDEVTKKLKEHNFIKQKV